MNFCGGEVYQQVEDYSSENIMSEPPMCGACVKVESEDQMDVKTNEESSGPAQRYINSAKQRKMADTTSVRVSTTDGFSSENEYLGDRDGTNSLIGKRISMPTLTPPRPLDTSDAFDNNSTRNPTSLGPSSDGVNEGDGSFRPKDSYVDYPTPRATPSSRKPGSSSLYTSSPSPILLNPLSDSTWSGKPKPNLLCPTLERRDTSTPTEQLMVRLEDGFRVRFVGGPGSETWKGHILRLFLHRDRTRLCLETNKLPEEKKEDSPDYVLEMHVHKILKLEVKGGRRSRPRRTFSLALQDGNETCYYYDFEARSALEREVVVSTVVVLLDQSCHTPLPMRLSGFPGNEFERNELVDMQRYLQERPPTPQQHYPNLEGGTMDQPILCSPSLRDEVSDTGAVVGMEALHLSPQRRTQIRNEDEGTETSLVIHLDNTFSNESQNTVVSEAESLPRETSQESLKTADTALGDTASQQQQQPVVHQSLSSSAHLAENWCTDDVCTLALRDIADTCTGIFELKQGDSACLRTNDVSSEQSALLAEYIATAMGAPTAVYSYIMESDAWNVETAAPRGGEGGTRRIENRANRLNAQALRLRNLRNEMTFAAALKKSQEKMHFVQTTQSFDDAARHPTGGHLNAASKAVDRLHSSPLLQHVVDTMMLNDIEVNRHDEASVAYYDSDPEDVKPRTIHKRAPRRVAAERGNVLGSKNGKVSRQVNSKNLEKIPAGKKVKRLDEDAVVDIVQTMSNERLILMWHPTQTKDSPNLSPICVKAWIETGVYLVDGTFLLPKLTWIKASEDEREGSRRKYKQHQEKALQKFDLLEVCRICPTDTIDRKRHPFASSSTSFYIETGSEVFLMEAQNTEERDRIVYGLKLVIARLASLLMLRDMRAADEFFGAMISTVPGEAPQWAQGDEQQTTLREDHPSLPPANV